VHQPGLTIVVDIESPSFEADRMTRLRRIAPLLAFVACADPTADVRSSFLGTWYYDPGATMTMDCSGQQTVTPLPDMSLIVRESLSAELELVQQDDRCQPLHLVIDGKTATALDEPCEFLLGGSGCPARYVYVTRYPFTISLDATRQVLTIEGHVTSVIPSSECGSDGSCTTLVAGTARKKF
jgi:hypothetical protein